MFGGTIFWIEPWGGWWLLLGPLLVVLAGLIWRGRPVAPPVPAIGNPATVV